MTRKGFTLVELLISITIVSVAAVAIYSVFANGVAAWRRGNRNKTYARSLRITSEKIARDLHNTFKFTDIPFQGEEDFVMFPALILTQPEKTSEYSESYYQVGRVAYFYDRNKNSLNKEEKPFPEIASESDKTKHGEGEAVIERVREVEFSYCYLDNATGKYKWKDDWKEEEQDSIPQAVKIKLMLEKGADVEEFEKTVFIPVGTGEQKKELGSVTIDLGT